MDKDWLLYLITSFTFAIIFAMCYIRHVFTFFERQKIMKASYPTFPFGNLFDVVSQKTSMSMQIWKFYIKFKRKKCLIGGFYLFLKPVLIITDPTKIVLQEEKKCFDVESDELRSTLFDLLCAQIQTIWFKMVSNLNCEEDLNFTKLMGDFENSIMEEIFDLRKSPASKVEIQNLNKENIFLLLRKLISMNYLKLKTLSKKKHKTNKLYNVLYLHMKNNNLINLLRKYGFKEDVVKEFVSTLVQSIKKSTSTIVFTFYELSSNVELQKGLRAELIRFTKENGLILPYDKFNKLEYLEMIICETLRKFPLEPFIYKTLGNNQPQNYLNMCNSTLIFLSIFGIHHDAENYINPELFDPDRFSEENLHFIEPHKYLPNGFRCHNDFGTVFIKMIMKIILLKFLPNFKFSLGQKAPKNIIFDTKYFNTLKLNEHLWLQLNHIK